MRKIVLLMLALSVAAAPAHVREADAPVPPSAPPVDPNPAGPADYAASANWLCLPGREDACSRPLPTRELEPDGYGAPVPTRIAADPPIDCFYLYPTVSRDRGFNSDLSPGMEERAAIAIQFARFASVCRPFVPVYRSGTVMAVRAVMGGLDPQPIFDRAYGDVGAAWAYYLQHHNRGRPVVLIGHSQGAIYLIELLKREFDGRPLADRLVSALVLGYNVEVPQGRVTGGTFRSLPLCTQPGQTGCIIAYVSFRDGSAPPEDAMFGRAAAPGHTVACTNPAALGRTDWAPLESYWLTISSESMPSNVTWSRAGPPPTPFLRTRGLVSGACVQRGRTGYFSVRVHADPNDARTDEIPGDVDMFGMFGMSAAGWGIHLVDINVAQGDLIRLVEAQGAAWRARRR